MTAEIWLYNPQREAWNQSTYCLLRKYWKTQLSKSFNGWKINKKRASHKCL